MKKIIIMALLSPIIALANNAQDALKNLGVEVVLNALNGKETSSNSVNNAVSKSIHTGDKHTDKLAKGLVKNGIEGAMRTSKRPITFYTKRIEKALNKGNYTLADRIVSQAKKDGYTITYE